MVLDTLLNKKVKVWSVLANTINGVRGTMKGQVGVLTSFDDEFIVLDKMYILSRKFIYRIEYVYNTLRTMQYKRKKVGNFIQSFLYPLCY